MRQLLLNREVTKAVTYVWKTCMMLKEAPEMRNLSSTRKEECLLAFLQKIFIESENKSTDKENENVADASKSEQDDNKRKEEISLRKRVINYLTVRDMKLNKAILLNCL